MILKGQKEQIEIPCTVKAEGDRGKIIEDKLFLVVKTYPVSKRNEILKGIEDQKGPEFIKEHLVEWREFKDAEGNVIAFSHKALDEVLEVGPYYDHILDGVKEGVFGKRLALKIKN